MHFGDIGSSFFHFGRSGISTLSFFYLCPPSSCSHWETRTSVLHAKCASLFFFTAKSAVGSSSTTLARDGPDWSQKRPTWRETSGALCSFLLQGFAGNDRAISGAVTLATIAVATHENGRTATRAQETSRWWLHRPSCTDEGWAGQCLMFREILTSATSPSRGRGAASGLHLLRV